jgi:hypothetical protein
MHRYFRTDNDGLYESIRLQLDAAWMLPNNLGTATCIPPAAKAQRDSQGRILLAAPLAFCEYPEVAALLPDLLSAGMVEEIDSATYQAFLPPPA